MSLLRKIGTPLLLMAVSSVLSLALCEIGLRLFRPVQYLKPPAPPTPEEQKESLYRPSSIPGLTYEMVPGRSGILLSPLLIRRFARSADGDYFVEHVEPERRAQ